MIDIIQALYDYDPMRFALWELLDVLHIDGIVRFIIGNVLGMTLWEDFSISK